MPVEDSLCRVDWKLGQALMPDHFLWQEDSLRREWEIRFGHQQLPMWGVAALSWDEQLLQKGRLYLNQLQIVFESGVLVDVPGNARPPEIELPKPGHVPVDIYVHLLSEPEFAKGQWTDQEVSLVELRLQKLKLATELEETPTRGLRLLRLAPLSVEAENKVKQAPAGWHVDLSYVPPLILTSALPVFAHARLRKMNAAVEVWDKLLRRQSLEHCLAVHKRVEATLYLRRAREVRWHLRQMAASLPPSTQRGADHRQAPAIRVHPFELYRQLVSLYLDIFSFQCGPLPALHGSEPRECLYRHDALAECFGEVESEIEKELERPVAGSPEWAFKPEPEASERLVCRFPKGLSAEAELYFLIQFTDVVASATPVAGPDPRLRGLKLAAPMRLEMVHNRVLPGILLERLHLVPFPHNFDPASVQFWRIKPSGEWSSARAEGAVAYDSAGMEKHRSFLYCPDMPASSVPRDGGTDG